MDDTPQVEEVQHPTLGTLKFPVDMPYQQRNAVISEMLVQRALSPDPRTGQATAAPTGIGPWIQSVENDVRTGSATTLPGKFLHALGARGTDAGVSQGAADQGPASMLLGPLKMAEGVSQIPSRPLQAAGKIIGGGLQAASIPLAFTGNAPGVAEKALAQTVPSIGKEAAGQMFGEVAQAANKATVNASAPGDVALHIQELAQRGGSMPKVVRDFLRRTTNPDGGPLTYEEARDFYSNASRLSADEFNRLTPVVRSQVAKFTAELGKSISDAAASVGQQANYSNAMSLYAKSAQRAQTLGAVGGVLKDALVKALVYGPAAGVASGAAYGTYKALNK